MTKKEREICENLGWYVTECKDDIELEQYSPAGEDFLFYADKKNFVDSVREYADGFDPDEHAEMWVENMHRVRGVPQSIRTLIDDADAIKEMLSELSDALIKNSHRRIKKWQM